MVSSTQVMSNYIHQVDDSRSFQKSVELSGSIDKVLEAPQSFTVEMTMHKPRRIYKVLETSRRLRNPIMLEADKTPQEVFRRRVDNTISREI